MKACMPWLAGLSLVLATCPSKASEQFESQMNLSSWQLFGGPPVDAVIYASPDNQRFGREESIFRHRWRKFGFEQLMSETKPQRQEARLYKTSISRLSYMPVENLTVRLTRGKLSGLDYLMADESLRRTAVSATYVFDLPGARLESTAAWGRSSRRMRQSTSGFLIESIARFSNSRAVFGRLEQVGTDEPGVDEAARAWTRLSRLSVGYVREHDVGKGARLQLGGYISHYRMPDGAGHGQTDSALGMLVMRLELN